MVEVIAILTFVIGLLMIIRGQQYISLGDKRFHQVTDIACKNQAIVQHNTTLLSKIELSMFEAKEAGVFLYDHYRAMLDVLDNCDEESGESLDEAARITNDALEVVEDSFYKTFGVTPEQWKSQKSKVLLYNKKTGKSYPSDMMGVN